MPHDSSTLSAKPSLSLLIALGFLQILSWGTLYYSIAVFARPFRQFLDLPNFIVFGAFSTALLVCGFLSPLAGRWLDTSNCRIPLATGSIAAGLGLTTLAISTGPLTYVIGWLIIGFAMSLSLYEPVFSVLHKLFPIYFRKTVTVITLLGGFASTLVWPISDWLIITIGWREALLLFAVFHIAIGFPFNLFLFDDYNSINVNNRVPLQSDNSSFHDHKLKKVIFWLSVAFGAAAFVFSVLSIMIIDIFETRGFERAHAILLAASIGPMQVFGRIFEWRFGKLYSARHSGLYALVFLTVSMTILCLIYPVWTLGFLFVFFYGVANGVLTIARGAVPAEILGDQLSAERFGLIARPVSIARAVAPAIFAGLLAFNIQMTNLLVILLFTAMISLFSYYKALDLSKNVG